MNQSFNGLRKAYYQCRSAYDFLPTLCVALPLFAAYAITLSFLPLMCTLAWCVVMAGYDRLVLRGHPVSRARLLTENFYAVRRGARSWIYQRKPPKGIACTDYLRSLLQEQRTLPASLVPGRYRTITHTTILRRLQDVEGVIITRTAKAYQGRLKGLRGRACKRCPRMRCVFGSDTLRQFYDVTFVVQ